MWGCESLCVTVTRVEAALHTGHILGHQVKSVSVWLPLQGASTSVLCQLNSHQPANSLLIWPSGQGNNSAWIGQSRWHWQRSWRIRRKKLSLSLNLIFVCSRNAREHKLFTCQMCFRINYPFHPWTQLAHAIMQESRKRNDRPCKERTFRILLCVCLSGLIVCFQWLLFWDQYIAGLQLLPDKHKNTFKHQLWLTGGLFSAVKRCYAWSFGVCVQPK